MSKRRRQPVLKWFVVTLGGGLLGLILFLFSYAGNLYDGLLPVLFDARHPPEVDVIVVLAGGRGRVAAGAELWEIYRQTNPEQKPPALYLSGTGPHSQLDQVLAAIRPEIRARLDQKNTIIERESLNTEENALWFLQKAREQGWQHMILVTSTYHMKRAEKIFHSYAELHNQKLQVIIYPVFVMPFSTAHWRSSWKGFRVTVREYFKWIYYQFIWRPTAAEDFDSKI